MQATPAPKGSTQNRLLQEMGDFQASPTQNSEWASKYANLNPTWSGAEKEGGFYNNAEQFGQGIVKGGISTLRGASTLGENIIKGIGRIVTPKSWEEKLGFAKTEKSSADQLVNAVERKLGMAEGNLTKPDDNPWEKAGFMTEQILEFFAPSAKIAKLEKGANLLTRTAIEATAIGGQTAIQKGAFDDDAKTGALIGAAFPLAGAAFSALAKPIKSAMGKSVTKSSEEGLFKIIKPYKSDIDNGFDVKNIFKHDVSGNLGQILAKTENKLNGLYAQLKTGLKNSNAETDLAKVLKETEKRLFNKSLGAKTVDGIRTEAQAKLGQGINDEVFKNFADAGGIKRIFKNLVDDVADVTEGSYKAGLYESNLIKQGAGTKGAWHWLTSPDAKPIETVYNTFYDVLKKEIETVGKQSGVKNIGELNKAMSELIPIKSAVIRRMPVADRNNALSLTDSILGLGAVFNPKALALLGISKLSKSGRFMSFLHRAGENLQKPAQRGAIGERIFGGNIDDLKNMPAGLSIKDVSVKAQNVKKFVTEKNPSKAVEAMADKELEALGMKLEYNDMFDGYDILWEKAPTDIKEAQDRLAGILDEFEIPYKTNQDGTIKMYHGTDSKSAKSIADDGFESGTFLSSVIDEEVGGVNGASYYGDTIVSANVDPRTLAFRTNGEFYIDKDGGVKNIIIEGKKALRKTDPKILELEDTVNRLTDDFNKTTNQTARKQKEKAIQEAKKEINKLKLRIEAQNKLK